MAVELKSINDACDISFGINTNTRRNALVVRESFLYFIINKIIFERVGAYEMA